MAEVLLATFHCDATLFGLPVRAVREVLGEQDVQPAPRSPAGVVGIINLRGRILAVTDVRTRLGLPPGPESGSVYFVVDHEQDTDVLRVDHPGAVVAAQEAEAVAVPDTTPADIAAQVSAAYQVEGALVLVVDLRRLLAMGQAGAP
jgi:purine-binding chemotaxis protein CheW